MGGSSSAGQIPKFPRFRARGLAAPVSSAEDSRSRFFNARRRQPGQPVINLDDCGGHMTDAASALRAAAECLFAPLGRWEIDEGIKWVEAAIAALPPGTDPDLVRMVETLDWQKLEVVADELERKERPVPSFSVETKDDACPSFPTRKRQRKPSIRTLIKQAEKSGKPVTSVTTPEGVTLRFDQPEPTEAGNPWLADLKVTKQ
jgi:hypothetical protein